MNFSTIIAGEVVDMEFSPTMDTMRVIQKKSKQKIDCVPLSANSLSLILNGQTYYLTITAQLDGYEVTVDHHTHFVKVKNSLELLLEKFGMESKTVIQPGEIHAQIPGLVSHIFVKEGDKVKSGDKLCILEAMKMENEITAPKNGSVTRIHIDSGENVEKGDLIMEVSN